MSADGFSLAATIILLFPMLYFLIASLTFFLANLGDPTVTWMMRGLFNTYFLAMTACCALGALAFASAGRPGVTVAIAALAILAIAARRWFLRRMDEALRARDSGDGGALRRLRRIHCGGIAYNAAQFAVVVASIPFVFRGSVA